LLDPEEMNRNSKRFRRLSTPSPSVPVKFVAYPNANVTLGVCEGLCYCTEVTSVGSSLFVWAANLDHAATGESTRVSSGRWQLNRRLIERYQSCKQIRFAVNNRRLADGFNPDAFQGN